MKQTLAAILLFLPFVMPVALQIIWGIRNIKHKTRLKIWQIALINMTIMVFCVFLLDIFMMRPAVARTRDGMAYVGLIALTLLTIIILLVVMAVLYMFKYRKQKRIIK